MGGREQGLGTKGDGEAGDAALSTGRRLHLELPRCLDRSRPSGESDCGALKGSPSPSALGHHDSQEHPGWCLPPHSAPPPRPNRPRIRAPPSSLRAKGDGGLKLGKKGSWRGRGQMSPLATLAGGRKPRGCSWEGKTEGCLQAHVEGRSLLLISASPGTRATRGSPRPCQPQQSPNTKSWLMRDTKTSSMAWPWGAASCGRSPGWDLSTELQ